jgi:integrase
MDEKTTRQNRGNSRPYQRKSDGRWCGTVELPIASDGTRRRKTIVRATEALAKSALKEERKKLAVNRDMPTTVMTTGRWVNHWYSTIAVKKIRPRTAANYRSTIKNHIIPSIGRIRLDKLTPEHIQKLHDDIIEKKLSSTTALLAHQIMSVALKYAVRAKQVTENVADLTDAPRKKRTKLAILTPLDGVKVLEAALVPAGDETPADRLGSRWAAALLTGARQGELLGLELNRITDVIDISWQLQRISWEHGCKDTGKKSDKGKPVFECGRIRGTDCPARKVTMPADWEYRSLEGGLVLSRPKSHAGERIIPLVEPLKSIIALRIEQAATEPNPHGLLWTADPKRDRHGRAQPLDGSPIDPRVDSEAWHSILKRAGVGEVRLHDCRHTTASLLQKAGVSDAVIIKILGHSSFVTSMGYIDIDREQLGDAMTAISGLLPYSITPKL